MIRAMSYLDRITIDSDQRFGKPCIRGMRFTVGDIFDYLASGMTEAEIIADFPELVHEDFLASYEWAAAEENRRARTEA